MRFIDTFKSRTIKLIAALLLTGCLAVSGLTGCAKDTGFTGLPSLLKMVPDSYDQVQYVNVAGLRDDKDLYQYYLNFKERLDANTEDMGILAGEVQHFGLAIDERLKVFYLQGSFDPDSMSATFEANGCRKEVYRDYELWTGTEYTAVIRDNLIIFSDLANAVRDCLDTMVAPETSLYQEGFKDISTTVPDDIYAIAATGDEAHYDGAISVSLGLTKVDDDNVSVTYRIHCENDSSAKDTIALIESTIGSTLFFENFSVEQHGYDVLCRFEAPNLTIFDFDF